MTSIETLVVIGLGFAGVAPYLGIASGAIGLGTVGIIAMQLVCAFAVVGFYTGEELPGLLTLRALDSNMHGTASVSGHFVPPKATLPASATILIRGMPKQKSGAMQAVIEFADANGHSERLDLKLGHIPGQQVA
jgi:hypothetical protein